jgi:rare lipoprotein A
MKISLCLFALLLVCTALLAANTFEGNASWYGGKFQGRRTANGEIFDTNKFTAAHKTMPFGTLVKVTSLKTERSVIVRINDRGPFVEDRIIDLSKAAADAIGLSGTGVSRVRIEAIGRVGGEISMPAAQPRPRQPAPVSVEPAQSNPVPARSENSSVGVDVQVGAFGRSVNAESLKSSLEAIGLKPVIEQAPGITRVLLRNVSTESLLELRASLKKAGVASILVLSKR